VVGHSEVGHEIFAKFEVPCQSQPPGPKAHNEDPGPNKTCVPPKAQSRLEPLRIPCRLVTFIRDHRAPSRPTPAESQA